MNNKSNIVKLMGAVAAGVLVLAGLMYVNTQKVSLAQKAQPNIIFILTDDLDFKLMPYMEKTNQLIKGKGVTVENYFVTSSACCPSRASTFRGQYPHNTGVLENSQGFEVFYQSGKEKETIATWLERAGYQNSLLGKYLNLYPLAATSAYVPPGWADWHSFHYGLSPHFYFAYSMNENGEVVRYHKKPDDYSTDVLNKKAIEFITKSVEDKKPFFVFLSVYAPHGPSTPAPRHANLFAGLEYPQGPSFHEEDISDKPFIINDIRRTGGLFETEEANALFRKRVQSVQAIDEMVEDLINLLEQNGQLENTYIFFTSDNGFHMGEHGLPSGKMLAYEEDIHVPLYVRGPGIQPGSEMSELVANIDIAPTIAEMAGADVSDFVDGVSFFSLILDSQGVQNADWRKSLLIETGDYTRDTSVIAYRGIRSQQFQYIEYENDEIELYNMILDPYQLNNIASLLTPSERVSLHFLLRDFKQCEGLSCQNSELDKLDEILARFQAEP